MRHSLVSLFAWALSDIGRKRSHNEDSYFFSTEEGIFVIADGMGGHKGGEFASKLAVDSSVEKFLACKNNHESPEQALEHAFNHAACTVYDAQRKNHLLSGMGTTLSALAILHNKAFIAHIGDTRIYCIRDKNIHQLTSDHSLVNEQVQAGIMSAEEARTSSLRNIITRAIGHNKEIIADYFSLTCRKNDLFLLCSDGLNNMLQDQEILFIINNNTPEQAALELINAANKNGGEDNISVILISIKK